jgi:CRISPR-associated protein Csy1
MKNTHLSEQIAKYIQGRASDKLQKFDKETEKKRKTITGAMQLTEWDAENQTKRIELENNFIPSRWLTDASKRAKQISIVTHALKFTHTDAKGSSVYMSVSYSEESTLNNFYLSTAALQSIQTDVVGNAAALDVAGLLQLEQDGESLISLIARNDNSALQPFASSQVQLLEWMNGFQQVLTTKALSSHTLAKQVFFPISATEYHLLSPLFSSSLAQALHQRINNSRYGEAAKEVRKARREKKYAADHIMDYPGIVVQNFGGTKPQNVSQLNSSRGGKSYLLSCAPPKWDGEHFSEPLETTCVIKKEYNRLAWRQAKDLQKYLLGIQDKSSNEQRRQRRAEHLDELINTLLSYAARVRNLPPGWSAQSKLPRAQQLWLDPKRSDADFKREREKNDWQTEIRGEFAHWLNRKLKHEKLTMADPEYQHFHKLLKDKLRELEEDLEVTI